MTIVDTAVMIATVAHKAVGQKRKYTAEDYITHPIAVSKIVMQYTDCDYAIAAALLHDVVEDTDITEEDLRSYLEFNHSKYEADKVVDLVMEVTKVSELEDGLRKVRRTKDHIHFAGGSASGQLIKAADSFHNCKSLAVADKRFVERYVPEKFELTAMLTLAPKELTDKLVALLEQTVIDFELKL